MTFDDHTDPDTGVFQPACNMCGDCCSGCNYGSKNTTLMNYLPRAHAAGATIVTQAKTYMVDQEDPGNGPWRVHVDDISGETPVRHRVTADIVVLSAGSLGSTEIMHRSKRNGLKCSDRVGLDFSGNGDVLGFGFDAFWNNEPNDSKDPQLPIYGIGAGPNRPDIPQYQPGPCITGVIKVDMDDAHDYRKGMVIEEGVAPGAVSLAMPLGLFMQQALNGDFTRFPDVESRLMAAQSIGLLFTGGGADASKLADLAYEGPAAQTQTFLVMSHDNGDGRLEMNGETDAIVVDWPGVGDQPNYINVNNTLEAASDSIWANYLPNPLWRPRFGRKLITVHPVGGCAMGNTAHDGVVDHACRVFTGNGADVHDGLYVCDGAVIPTSLGLNPLLTITAVSERAMDILAADIPVKIQDAQKTFAIAAPELADASEPGEPITARLDDIIKIMDDWQTEIDLGEYEKVRAEIVAKIKAYFPAGEQDAFWESFKGRIYALGLSLGLSDAELAGDIKPALAYVSGVIKEVKNYIAKGEYVQAAQYLERECGDFSPDLAFSETMHGFVCAPHQEHAPALSNPYDVAAKYGEFRGQTMVADFHIVAHSLKKLTESDAHEANLTGQIHCPYLSDEPLVIGKGGRFNLLIANRGKVETWNMIYACRCSGGGKDYYFKGVKTLERRPGSNWWTDLTTLSVDLYEGDDESGTRVAMGVITLGVQDLLKQLSTVTSDYEDQKDNNILMTLATDAIFWGDLRHDLNDKDKRQALLRKLIGLLAVASHSSLVFQISAYFLVKFAGFFGLLVFRAYGEMLAYLYNFPGRLEQEGKVKQLPPPQGAKLRGMEVYSSSHWLPNDRERRIHLTRYDGRENKFSMNRTVVLAPGFATRGASYVMETVDENITESLVKAGYDVWLLDYRSSPMLESSLKPFTLDNVAKEDWPMAVEFIRETAGVHDMQAVVHCMGSMTHLMALLNGMQGIRSVVSSQLTLHPVTNWFNKFKADTYIARMLRDGLPSSLLPMADALAPNKAVADLFRGLRTIDANSVVDPEKDEPEKYMQDQVINMLTWEVPFPNDAPCYSPTCHRIFGIYGPVFAHEQLNEETHNAVQTVFGELSTRPFQHIAEIVRQGIAVDAEGQNTYLEHYENLRLPITFLAGALNQEFMPDTSLRTLNWLTEVNPKQAAADYYDRLVWQDYAHMDFFLGKNSSRDIYPSIIKALQRHDEILSRGV